MEDLVYVIGAPGSCTVKIGRSEHPHARARQIQLMSPVLLEVLWTHPGGRRLEKALHAHFADYRSHGEWFTFPAEPLPIIQAAVTTGGETRPAGRPAKPERNPKELRMNKCRALYLAVRDHFNDEPFSVADVSTAFGLNQGLVRLSLKRLFSEGLLAMGDPAPGLYANRPRQRYVVRPLPEGCFIGAPSYGASVPQPVAPA